MRIYDHAGVVVREARREDVEALQDRLRQADVAEAIACGCRDGREGLEESFSRSTLRFTVVKGGTPVAMFGVVPDTLLGPYGRVWLLGAEELSTMKKTFVKQSRRVIAEFLRCYPVLYNVVDARYPAAIRWLESCGAVFGPRPIFLSTAELRGFFIRRAA